MTSRPQRTEVLKLPQRVLGPIADAGQGGAKARGSPAHGSILGRLSKNFKKDVSHAYKSKKTPFGTTQQSTRQAPSSSTQTQLEFELSLNSIITNNHDRISINFIFKPLKSAVQRRKHLAEARLRKRYRLGAGSLYKCRLALGLGRDHRDNRDNRDGLRVSVIPFWR